VTDDLDLGQVVRDAAPVDYLVVDEAQFLTRAQVDQLGVVADELAVDVFAFGIATDFRGRLFPGSARLFEVADQIAPVQVEVLCWCGRPGRFNARLVHGRISRDGPTIMIADTRPGRDAGQDAIAAPASETGRDGAAPRYRVLCRRHYRAGSVEPE
jgi:thymidine kinase